MAEGLHTKKTRAQFGGPTTSDKYNERVSSNFKDLSLLHNRVGVAEERLTEIIRQQHKTIASLDKSIGELENRLDAANDEVVHVSFDGEVVELFDGTSFEILEPDRLEVSPRYNSVGLRKISAGSESRIRYQDSDGNSYLPSSFAAVARGVANSADDSNAIINESDVFNSFLGKAGRVWERNVVADSFDQDGAVVSVYVGVPVDVAPSLRVNKLTIDPFPARGVDILGIYYSTKAIVNLNETDGYEPLNDKALHINNTRAIGVVPPGGWDGDEITNAGAATFDFDAKEITALKITLRTKNYYTENGKVVYTYGLADLDIRSERHLDVGKTILQVDAPDGVSNVHDVIPQIYNVSPLEAQEIFEYRTIWESSFGSGQYGTDPVPFSTRFWIEVTLRKTAGGGSPIISSIDVDYS